MGTYEWIERNKLEASVMKRIEDQKKGPHTLEQMYQLYRDREGDLQTKRTILSVREQEHKQKTIDDFGIANGEVVNVFSLVKVITTLIRLNEEDKERTKNVSKSKNKSATSRTEDNTRSKNRQTYCHQRTPKQRLSFT
jgi:hypothetical protein